MIPSKIYSTADLRRFDSECADKVLDVYYLGK